MELHDWEGYFFIYLQDQLARGVIQGDEPVEQIYAAWQEIAIPELGLSPRQYFDRVTEPEALVSMLQEYISGEEYSIPDILQQRLEQMGAMAVPALLAQVQRQSIAELDRPKEIMAAVVAGQILNQFKDRRVLPVYLDLLQRGVPLALRQVLVKGLQVLGKDAGEAVVALLPNTSDPDVLLALAAVLAGLDQNEVYYPQLIMLWERLPQMRGMLSLLLGSYGDRRAVPLVQSVLQDGELQLDDYDLLRQALRQLGETEVSRQDLEQQRLDSQDPEELSRHGLNFFLEGDLDRAAALYKREIELRPESWEGYLHLARTEQKAGDLEQARQLIQQALTLAEANWLQRPDSVDYELLEQLHRAADDISGQGDQRRLQRWLSYARGALYFYGVLPWPHLLETIALTTETVWPDRQALWAAIQNNDLFQVFEPDLVAAADVGDPLLVIKTRRANLTPKPWNLTALQLAAEGRVRGLLPHEGALAAGQLETVMEGHLRLQPRLAALGLFSVERILVNMRNAQSLQQVAGPLQQGLGLTSEQDLSQWSELLQQAWNHNPRWELWGWAPVEVWQSLVERQNIQMDTN